MNIENINVSNDNEQAERERLRIVFLKEIQDSIKDLDSRKKRPLIARNIDEISTELKENPTDVNLLAQQDAWNLTLRKEFGIEEGGSSQ